MLRQIRVIQPAARALEPQRVINALDLAQAARHLTVEPQEGPETQKAQPEADVSKQLLRIKATKAITDVCDRYDGVMGKPLRVSWDSGRDMARVLGQFVKNAETLKSPATIISQASSTFTKRSRLLQNLSYNLLTAAHHIEVVRVRNVLKAVETQLSKRGFSSTAKSIRATRHAASKPLLNSQSPTYRQPVAGTQSISILRRETHLLKHRQQEHLDERNDTMVQLLEECVTAVGRMYRLEIELEVVKPNNDVDYRTMKLNVQEALRLLDRFRPDRTAGAGADTESSR